MRKLLSVIGMAVWSLAVWSVPARREPILRYGADGRVDTVWLHGDEYYHYYTDTHGEVIAGSVYQDQGLEQAAAIRRSPQHKMIGGYVPKQGKVRVPVLLVNFTDKRFTMSDPKTQFTDFYNGNGGSNPYASGSVHNYYTASSNGQLDLQYEVWGPYDLEHDMAYYGGNKKSGETTTSHNVHAAELVKEAVQLAYDNGVDFSQYDADHDGNIDNVSIVVAGYNEAEGGDENTIWPHYSVIYNSKAYNGKYICGYLMISELRGNKGKTQAGIGTYCHEFGHALGLPDLYDTKNSEHYTVGSWDVMCNGCYNNHGSTPPTFSAFERFMMGWMMPKQLQQSGMQSLAPLETDNCAYLVAAQTHNLQPSSPSPREYFLIENRQRLGWDAGTDALIATGLLISHITFDLSSWNGNTFNNGDILGYSIVNPRTAHPSTSSAADIYPGSTKCTYWTPTLNDGKQLSDLAFSQIRAQEDGNMTWLIGKAGEDMLYFAPEEVTLTTPFLKQALTPDTMTAMLHIPAMPKDTMKLYVESDYFQFSPDSGAHWYKKRDTARIAVRPYSNYNIPVMAVHTPSRQSCEGVYSYLVAEKRDQSAYALLTLAGMAPRPVLISTPVIDSVSYVSSTTFGVSWEVQDDADWYYYTVYTIENGERHDLYPLGDKFIYGSGNSIVFRDLQPATTYYYAMQAYEEKGCEPHYSELSEPIAIRTHEEPTELKLTIIRDAQGYYSVQLPDMADGVHYIDIYDNNGRRYLHAKPPFGTYTYALPALPTGQLYLVKYYSGEKFKRKDIHAKLLSY